MAVPVALRWAATAAFSSVPDPDGSEFFSPIRIRTLKTRIWILPLTNQLDRNDVFDKVLEEPDQKGQC